MINQLSLSPETVSRLAKVTNTSSFYANALLRTHFATLHNWQQRGVIVHVFRDSETDTPYFDGQIKKTQTYFITFPQLLDNSPSRSEFSPDNLNTSQSFYFDGQVNQGRLENAKGEIILFITDELGRINQALVLVKRKNPAPKGFFNKIVVLSGVEAPVYPAEKTDRPLNEEDFLLLVDAQLALNELFHSAQSQASVLRSYWTRSKVAKPAEAVSTPRLQTTTEPEENNKSVEEKISEVISFPTDNRIEPENREVEIETDEEDLTHAAEDVQAPPVLVAENAAIYTTLCNWVEAIENKNQEILASLKRQQDFLAVAPENLNQLMLKEASALEYLDFNTEQKELAANWQNFFYPSLEEIKKNELTFIADSNWSAYQDTNYLVQEIITSFDAVLTTLFETKNTYTAFVKDFQEGAIASTIAAKDFDYQQLEALKKVFQQLKTGSDEFNKSLVDFGQTTKILLNINQTYPYTKHRQEQQSGENVSENDLTKPFAELSFPEHLQEVAAAAETIVENNNYLLQKMKLLQEDLARSEKIILGKVTYQKYARTEMNLAASAIESKLKHFETKNFARQKSYPEELTAFYATYQNAGENRHLVSDQVKSSFEEVIATYSETASKTSAFLKNLEQGKIKKATVKNPIAFVPALLKISGQAKHLQKQLENSQKEVNKKLEAFQQRVEAPIF